MPNGNNCQMVRVPVVLAVVPASTTVSNTTCLDEQAKKVDHIDVEVRDLEADPVFTGPANCTSPTNTYNPYAPDCGPGFLKTINFHGTVHKQIYYVTKDDRVRHLGEDIPFSDSIDLNPPLQVDKPRNVDIIFKNVDINVWFQLPRATRIQQNATVSFDLRVVEEQQLNVLTCTPAGGGTATLGTSTGPTLGIQNGSLENWTGNTPTFWQGTNIGPNPNGRTGQAAQLGVCTTLPATLAQTVTNIAGGTTYNLTFWAQALQTGANPCGFNLNVQLTFLDANGNALTNAQQAFTAQQMSTTAYNQFTLSGTAPADTTHATLAFNFTPEAWNTCSVLIDDVSSGEGTT